MARFFLGTKSIKNKTDINLISIGVVSEDGKEMYAINEDCNFSEASDSVLENILIPMGITLESNQVVYFADITSEVNQYGMTDNSIKDLLLSFCGENAVFWVYSDDDWIALRQLFNNKMPQNYYHQNLKRKCKKLGDSALLPENKSKHSALEDAKWAKKVFEFLGL